MRTGADASKRIVGMRTRWRKRVGSARIGPRTERHHLSEMRARYWAFAKSSSAREPGGLSTVGPYSEEMDCVWRPGGRRISWRV